MYTGLLNKVFAYFKARCTPTKISSFVTLIIFLSSYISPAISYGFENQSEGNNDGSIVEGSEVEDPDSSTVPLPEENLEEQEESDEQEASEPHDEGTAGETEPQSSIEQDPESEDVEEENDLDEDVTSESSENDEDPIETWIRHEDGSYETSEVVLENKEYVIEEFDNLKIIFTKIVAEAGKLYVKVVTVPESVGDAKVIGRAYDISTDMPQGSFEYTLFMPKPDDSYGKKLDIKYTEDGRVFQDIEGEVVDDSYISTPGLDHFTVFFVVANPAPPPVSFLEMVIDNTEPEFSIVSGTWAESTSMPGYFGTNYRMSDINTNGSGEVQWLFQVFDSGNYEIYAWWPANDIHCNAATYTVNYQGGVAPITVDQETNGGQWNRLGATSYSFVRGIIYAVRLSNNCIDPDGNIIVVADAIRIRSTQAPSEVWVDDDWVGTPNGSEFGTGRIIGYNAFATIQLGINAVAPTGIVHVAEGTFTEQIDITKDLTLSGAGAGLTTILSPTSLTSKFATTTDNFPIVYIAGVSGVTIENLTIDGAGRGNLNNRFYGIAFRNAGGTVQNSSLINIREEPLASIYANHGVSIYAFNDDGLIRTVNILGNQISTYQKNGIAMRGNVYANIVGNTITGRGATNLVVQNGIQLYLGATGQILGNTISDNVYTGTDGTAVGILLINISPNLIISGSNEVFNNGAGVWNWEVPAIGSTSPITVHHNNFHGNTYNAIDDRADSVWDDGSRGNTWDDYFGIDLDGDHIGDTSLPYRIINTYYVFGDRYPLTSNYLTPPLVTAPPHDPSMHPVNIPAVEWGSADGTFPPFEYQIQGFSDATYTNVLWDSCPPLDPLSPPCLSTLNFSVAGIPDGTYYIRVRARDMYGNISYWSNDVANPYIITLDNNPPVTEDPLAAPDSDSYWNGIIPIAGRSTDIFSVDFVDLYYNVSGSLDPWTFLERLDNVSNSASFLWNSSWDPDGIPGEDTYDICAVATDVLGHVESTGCAYNVTYDVTSPVVVITSPDDLDVLSGTVTFRGTVTDDYPNHYQLIIEDSSSNIVEDTGFIYDSASFTDQFILDWDTITSSIVDGDYTITLIAYDAADNVNEVSIVVTIDNTKPYVEPELANAAYDEGGPIIIDITGYDDVGLSQFCYQIVEIDEGTFSCVAGNGTEYIWTLDLTTLYPSLLQDGVYTFEYYLLDSSTPPNQSDADENFDNGDQWYSAIFKVKNVAPIVTLLQDQTIDEGKSAVFSGKFTDPSFVAGSLNVPDDAPWTAFIDYGDGSGATVLGTYNEPGEIVIPDHMYKYNGVYTVRLTVRESNIPPGDGESGYGEVVVVVNNVVPFVRISASPATIVDEGTQVSLVAKVFGGNAPYTYKWTGACLSTMKTAFAPASAGTYICSVKVWDADGDVASAFINISVQAPVVEQEGENISSDEVLGVEDCDKKSEVSGYIFYDENRNGIKDEKEEGVGEVIIEIYSEQSGGYEIISTVKTDSTGYWRVELCPGDYSVGIDTDHLPKNVELEWGDLMFITVEEGKGVVDVNFPVQIRKSILDNFSLLWCVAPLVVLTVVGIFLSLINVRKRSRL